MELRRTLKAAQVNLEKAAPDIMVAVGVFLSGVAVIDFCKQTPKAEPVVSEYKSDISGEKAVHEAKLTTDAQYRKNVCVKTAEAGVKLAKVYWRPALTWTVSTGLVVGSHHILKGRNAALTAIATGLGTELRNLHAKIIERYGEDIDRELKHGIVTEEVEVKSIDEKTGEEVTETKQVKTAPVGYSSYARFFDEASRCWKDDAEYNLVFLKSVEADCNRILKADGVLFLNQVYEKLDIPRTKAGQHVGWVYYPSGDIPNGDNYVDFGIYNGVSPAARDFVNGCEPVILLDFNVDGSIIDTLPLR